MSVIKNELRRCSEQSSITTFNRFIQWTVSVCVAGYKWCKGINEKCKT